MSWPDWRTPAKKKPRVRASAGRVRAGRVWVWAPAVMLTARLLELTAVVSRLHEVCPWTKAQTVKEMLAFTRGELAEVEGAIVGVDAASRVELVEAELGDVLFDVLMLIETCSKEHGTGGLDAVCARSIAKLRGRAPYAFEGGPTIQTAEDAELFWQVSQDRVASPARDTERARTGVGPVATECFLPRAFRAAMRRARRRRARRQSMPHVRSRRPNRARRRALPPSPQRSSVRRRRQRSPALVSHPSTRTLTLSATPAHWTALTSGIATSRATCRRRQTTTDGMTRTRRKRTGDGQTRQREINATIARAEAKELR